MLPLLFMVTMVCTNVYQEIHVKSIFAKHAPRDSEFSVTSTLSVTVDTNCPVFMSDTILASITVNYHNRRKTISNMSHSDKAICKLNTRKLGFRIGMPFLYNGLKYKFVSDVCNGL